MTLSRSDLRATFRVVIPYLVFAATWIFFSDKLLLTIAPDVQAAVFYGIVKGMLFVLVSGLLLMLLLGKEHHARLGFESDRADLLLREQAARARAESASRAKDEMLAIVSHELRTPLTAILANTELLQHDDHLTTDQRELLESIQENVLQESRIVADLLDGSSLAAGKLELNFESVDLHEVLRSVVRDIQHQVNGKKIALTTQLAAGASHCRADRTRLSQAIRNLLTNAAKFTPAGGSIQILTSNSVGRLIIEVHDTGIGIHPDIQGRLFKPFEQGDRSITRQFGGLGLGLYLSRSIVELHGGSIAATSEGEGKGSTFRIEVPTVPGVEPAHLPPEAADAARKDLAVLLVEDNIDTLRVLARILGRMGCCVTAARSAAEATQIVETQRVDLLISDIGLPDRSGWDLMTDLRQRHEFASIAITGFSSNEDRQRSAEAGFDMHLVKPISYPALEAAVSDIAAQRAAVRAPAPATTPAT